MSATACFDLGYIVSDISEDERDTAQEQSQRFMPPESEEDNLERFTRGSQTSVYARYTKMFPGIIHT